MQVRHFNRALPDVRRYDDESQTKYPRRVTAAAAGRGGRRYDPDAITELTDAMRGVNRLALAAGRLAALGISADSPARLDPEAEQIARAERRS